MVKSWLERWTCAPSEAWIFGDGMFFIPENVWGECDLVVMENDVAKLRKQSVETTNTIKLINETLQGLGVWMPKVDTTINSLQQAIEAVGAGMATLEAAPYPALVKTPQAKWHWQRYRDPGCVG